jgi:uncharacterized PurR-regulated membrane protein YhhQ (DUF165 family)
MQSDPGQNPYAPPTSDAWNDTNISFEEVPQGTYWGGFAVGFIFALLGVIIVYFVGKEETKRGSWHGFGIRLCFSLLVGFLIIIAG